jgi:hypothetical protein
MFSKDTTCALKDAHVRAVLRRFAAGHAGTPILLPDLPLAPPWRVESLPVAWQFADMQFHRMRCALSIG